MRILVTLFALLAACLALSHFARIPYIYTVIGFASWVFIGHLVTLDDDAKGGWSNPEESTEIWKHSKKALWLKLLVLTVLIALTAIFPEVVRFGA